MAEIWDVAAHVESHPEDHAQRWRLAKKLYSAHEYRLALEHLNILKKEWAPKINVRRYLAATYFRLGRYEEAITELEDSIQEWPDEIGLREQLAYVLKADKEYERTLEAWEAVLKLQPDHAIAKKSIQKLKSLIEMGEKVHEADTKLDPLSMGQDDIPTPPPMPGMECPKCGAQNSEEFGDCWRCGNPLPHAKEISQPAIFDRAQERSFFVESKLLGRIGAATALVFLLFALFLGILLLTKYREGTSPVTSLSQIYDYELIPSRFAAGLAMLFFWPMILRFALVILRIKPRPKAVHTYIGGILLGAMALVVILMPMPPALLVPGNAMLFFMALVVSVIALQFRMAAALLVWVVHFTVMLILGFSVFWGVEMYRYGQPLNPVAEMVTLWKFPNMPSAEMNTGLTRLPSTLTPIKNVAQWQSSGSAWLDSKIGDITCTIRVENAKVDLRFQIYEDGKLQFHEELGGEQNYQFIYTVLPEKQYEFRVIGSENQVVQVFLQSLMPFKILG